MPTFRQFVLIEAPVGTAWTLLSEVSNWPQWLSTVASVRPLDLDRLEPGRSFEVRQPKLIPMTWVVTKVSPPTCFVWESRALGYLARASHELRHVSSDACTLELELGFRGIFGRPLGVLFSCLTTKYLAQEGQALKDAAEQAARGDSCSLRPTHHASNPRITVKHTTSEEDLLFQRSFESFEVAPSDFDHAAHVRLAYVYLCQHPADEAAEHMKSSLLAYLQHVGVGRSKFHETITKAWIMAVRHFMEQSDPAASSQEFVAANPRLLDTKIMLKHYSAEVLFSQEARAAFVQPDISAIPLHG